MVLGRTPNPCVRCNQWIKFGRLFDYANAVDATHVATGTMQELFIVMTQAIMFPFQKFTEAMMSHVISHMSYLGSRRIVYLE